MNQAATVKLPYIVISIALILLAVAIARFKLPKIEQPVVDLVRSVSGNVLFFSSGHFLRMLAARWAGIDTLGARSVMLSTASLSVLGYEGSMARPAIRLWNDTHHLLADNEPYINVASLQLTEVTK
jgi:hypothetical protein